MTLSREQQWQEEIESVIAELLLQDNRLLDSAARYFLIGATRRAYTLAKVENSVYTYFNHHSTQWSFHPAVDDDMTLESGDVVEVSPSLAQHLMLVLKADHSD